jgi:hypothetical protein
MRAVEVRAGLVDWLRLDLMGPSRADEELPTRPDARYTIGVLHPAFTAQKELDADEALVAGADDDSSLDVEPTYGGMRQSAIGISFSTSEDALPAATVEWGEYQPPAGASGPAAEAEVVDDDEADPGELAGGNVKSGWKRQQASHTLALSQPQGKVEISAGLWVDWRRKTRGEDVIWTVSFSNRRPKTQRPVFQPMIRVSLTSGQFRARPLASPDDPDAALSALLYRDSPEFAVGHGCAVDWTVATTGAVEVRTELIPSLEVPAVRPAGRTTAVLEQSALARLASQGEAAAAIRPIVAEYREWIRGRRAMLVDLPDDLKATAAENLRQCDLAADRMARGIERIEGDPAIWRAFRFMNHAMDLQRRQSLIAEAYRTTNKRIVKVDEVPTWRAFQLAFILMNIEGIADPRSPDRAVVDLLWFPTGGGKTEAYIGLTAFVIALARLQGQQGEASGQGVTVLMRYTLRLLTTQQFERALTLICACEEIRSHHPENWGTERITIGLWVGQGATPNSYDAAKIERDKLVGIAKASEKHPFVVRTCPWCGTPLTFPNSFVFDDDTRTISIWCANSGCSFSADSGLPALVIDETIYRQPPSLLLATVDKFARLPWEPDSASLFGRADRQCPRHGYVGDPGAHCHFLGEPESHLVQAAPGPGIALVIQDELHLISGPLGTLVGAYEAAVDFLAGRAGIGPKVVASTATIRSAREQIRGLYGRSAALFPGPALDPFDSFFAEPAPATETPGRLYVGLTAPGTSMKTALVRTYASVLSATVAARSAGEEVDQYWTLVGYFNSLRELGGALSLMFDDVPKRLLAMEKREQRPARAHLNVQELTSRIPSHEIPNRLRQMERTLESGDALDALLASNMISVGVDVGRLGLMVVAGQPKGTAEYIQATSRVGRRHPGLVLTIYNWTRPRDLSHYERFRSYHAALYRHVEATSVTPLSSRARDRSLEGVVVAALRLADARLRGNQGAGAIGAMTHADPPISEFLEYFRKRAKASDSDEAPAALLDLEARIDRWLNRAKAPSLPYRGSKTVKKHLIRPAVDEPDSAGVAYDPEAWPLLNSLRNVEREHGWYEV